MTKNQDNEEKILIDDEDDENVVNEELFKQRTKKYVEEIGELCNSITLEEKDAKMKQMNMNESYYSWQNTTM